MNQHDDFEDFLSRQLKANQAYVADEGFTEQVMLALPKRSRTSDWLWRLITSIALVVIGIIVIAQMPILETFTGLWLWFATAELVTLLKTGGAISGAILLMCLGWLAREMGLA